MIIAGKTKKNTQAAMSWKTYNHIINYKGTIALRTKFKNNKLTLGLDS